MNGHNANQTDPFARMEQTHRRIEERLAGLARAASELADGRLRMEALDEIYDTSGWFARGGARHVADEEETLFPHLRGIAECGALLAALEQEHRDHQALEKELGALVGHWGDEGPEAADEQRVAELARRLGDLYRVHIEREETELFPMAKRLLRPSLIAALGQQMMDRRPDRGKS